MSENLLTDCSSYCKLESLMADLRERVFTLKAFDPESEVHAYCDDLEGQVILTFQSAFKHLQEQQDKYLDEIKAYRSRLLEEARVSLRSLSCQSTEKVADIAKKWENLQLRLLSLSNQLSIIDLQCKEADLSGEVKQRAEGLQDRLSDLRRRMRECTFGKRFLKFKPNEWSFKQRDLVGKMEISRRENQHLENRTINLYQDPFATFNTQAIYVAKFLSNGCLITSSADRTLKLWNRVADQAQVLAQGYSHIISEILELSNGCFLTGSFGGEMILWNDSFRPIKRVSKHKDVLYSFQILPNGNIASLSLDDTINIWNAEDLRLVSTMSGHGCLKSVCRLSMLPDGFLVTCSDDLHNCKIRIWDPYQGKMVREIQTQLKNVVSFALLRNKDLALATRDGSVHLLNIDDQSRRKTLRGPKEGQFGFNAIVFELPDGNILVDKFYAEIVFTGMISASVSKIYSLEVWNPASGQLVQSIQSVHRDYLVACSISPDGRTLATASKEGKVNFWPLTYSS